MRKNNFYCGYRNLSHPCSRLAYHHLYNGQCHLRLRNDKQKHQTSRDKCSIDDYFPFYDSHSSTASNTYPGWLSFIGKNSQTNVTHSTALTILCNLPLKFFMNQQATVKARTQERRTKIRCARNVVHHDESTCAHCEGAHGYGATPISYSLAVQFAGSGTPAKSVCQSFSVGC